MADSRKVQFELHIRPLFRRKDRDSMLWSFDLWDYEAVKANAVNILNRLKVDMPPEAHGGIWPSEWISLFERWIDEGFGRLEMGIASYSASISGTDLVVVAKGTYPTETHRGWIQISEDSSTEFSFFVENQGDGGSPGFPFEVRETIPNEAPHEIIIQDANGENIVPVSHNA